MESIMDERLIKQAMAAEALNYMGNVPYWKKTPMTPINQMPDWMVKNILINISNTY